MWANLSSLLNSLAGRGEEIEIVHEFFEGGGVVFDDRRPLGGEGGVEGDVVGSGGVGGGRADVRQDVGGDKG